MPNIVERLIETLDPPTQAELARLCDKYPQEVNRWVASGNVQATEAVMSAIERATEGAFTRYELRPDVYGEAPAPAEPTKAAAA